MKSNDLSLMDLTKLIVHLWSEWLQYFSFLNEFRDAHSK